MKIGYCLTGSFCTFEKSIEQIKELVNSGYTVTPIMSENAYSFNTRFGKAEDFRKTLVKITGRKIIHTINEAEPIGPKNMFDLIIVSPCTGNTLAKLANGITDTSVTMAVKSHLRNSRPVLIGISTNDALGNSAKNIGALMNYKCYYFIPYSMDDPIKKPKSMVCNFEKTKESVISIFNGNKTV